MKVLAIPDTHFPWTNFEAMKKIYAIAKAEQPDAIIQMGDLLDQYIFSHFARKAGITAKHDVRRGLLCANHMWERLHQEARHAKCFQLLGNHDVRVTKRISEKLPELGDFFSHRNLYHFEGVKTLISDRDYLKLDGVVYCHGWLSKSIDHAKYFNSPTVHGHRHKPSLDTDGPLWSMDVGHVANENTVPLSYTATKFTRWRMACGLVEDKKPRLILL